MVTGTVPEIPTRKMTRFLDAAIETTTARAKPKQGVSTFRRFRHYSHGNGTGDPESELDVLAVVGDEFKQLRIYLDIAMKMVLERAPFHPPSLLVDLVSLATKCTLSALQP